MKRIISREDKGFVSIFTVLIIMAILSLVAIGFSNVTRRAQRRTIDNQLNTQAFYAAESGINDAKAALAVNPALTKAECQGPTTGFNYNLDPSLNIGYSCVLIKSQTSDLIFNAIPIQGTANPKVVALETVSGDNIGSFDVTWDATGSSGSTPITSDPSLVFPNLFVPSATYGSKLGVVRIDLVPTTAFDRSSLVTNSYTFFLYPQTTAAGSTHTVSAGTANQGVLLPIKCGTAPTNVSPCTATVNLAGSTSSKYAMRIQALYNNVQLTIRNVKDTSNNSETLQNGQAIVDVTGRAADVYRRIQVRLPIQTNGLTAPFALQTADSICKRLRGGPTSDIDPNNVPAADQTGACALTN